MKVPRRVDQLTILMQGEQVKMAKHISEAELKRRMAKMGSFVDKTKKGGGSTIPSDDKVKKPPTGGKDKKGTKNFLERARSRFQTKKLKQIEQATGQSTEDLKRGFKLKP